MPLLRDRRVPRYPLRLDGGRVRSASRNATSQNLLTDSRILERKDVFCNPQLTERGRGHDFLSLCLFHFLSLTSERSRGRENRALGDALCSHLHFRLRIYLRATPSCKLLFVSWPKVDYDSIQNVMRNPY